MGIDEGRVFVPVGIAVLTISDTRSLADDRSGDTLVQRVRDAGHQLVARSLVTDDVAAIDGQLVEWLEDPAVQVVLTTGGTGITGRDVTPEVVRGRATKIIEGFGELFRWLSYASVGTSTMQSRAVGAVCGTTLVFALPGSTGAVKDAWDGILVHQLDARHRPCNLVDLLPRLAE